MGTYGQSLKNKVDLFHSKLAKRQLKSYASKKRFRKFNRSELTNTNLF